MHTSPDIELLRDFSTIFSRQEMLKLMEGDFFSLDLKLERYADEVPEKSKRTYLDFVRFAYATLEQFYPNEYVYKNLILKNVLIEELRTSDSVVFNEYRVGDSVADLAVFNGVSKAFEIKTEFDNSSRLSSQIDSYWKIFNEVYLVVPESKVEDYKKIADVGILSLKVRGTQKSFEEVRPSVYKESIDLEELMKVFHTKEYRSIVHEYFGDEIEMNDFNQYEISKNLLSRLSNEQLQESFIRQMKGRKLELGLSKRNYTEFNQIWLSLKINSRNKANLIDNLKENI